MFGKELVDGLDKGFDTCACGCMVWLALLAAAAWGLWRLLT